MKINDLLLRLTKEKYLNRWIIFWIDLFLSVFSTVTSLALVSYILDLAKRCGMCTKTLNRSLVWLQEKDLIGLKRLNGGIRVCVCGYDSIMGIRRKEAGKDAPEQSAFLALEEAERRMGGRSMQFDCCTADGEGGLQ